MVSKIEEYFESHKEFICCKAGCSDCCEKGDYPVTEEELKILMLAYSRLENSQKIRVQENIKNMEKGGACPFLLDKLCSIYPYRPNVCRIHGLAYLTKDNVVKVPYCANNGKNYAKVYSNGEFFAEPIKENLDKLLGKTRNLYDWLFDLGSK
ncbi:MAG: YkgJ family cysteine cluster protein [Candidatus Gastranaerophilales bacterium]|nr:YkgJ family cysteine cluster protein [Candidatus Gastranaerophilales bacterium]MCM1072297.1 YkgJ family cysteine cluster protein [Bacteroides sp.]